MKTEIPLQQYYMENGLTLEAWELTQYDRTICFIINNRIEKAIDLENPTYRRIDQLMKAAIIAIQEMQYDVNRMLKKNHLALKLGDEYSVKDVLPVLENHSITTEQECIEYLEDVRLVAYSVLTADNELDSKTELLFKVVVQLCTIAHNRFYEVLKKPILVEEVSISFGRRRAEEELDEYAEFY